MDQSEDNTLTEEQQEVWDRLLYVDDPDILYKINTSSRYGVFYAPYIPIMKTDVGLPKIDVS